VCGQVEDFVAGANKMHALYGATTVLLHTDIPPPQLDAALRRHSNPHIHW
jgi:hypothetical protein